MKRVARVQQQITPREVSDLLKLIRAKERALRSGAKLRCKELIRNFERQVSRRYKFDEEKIWQEAMKCVEQEWVKANAAIAKSCAELGIPEEFAPGIEQPHWYSRGANAVAERRNELRRVAHAEAEEQEERALAQILDWSAEAQATVVEKGLKSPAAVQLLAGVRTLERLMPALDLPKLEKKLNQEPDDEGE
jgi:hypothetical protein